MHVSRNTKDFRAGDRFRAEVVVRGQGTYLSYEIDMTTAELIEPAMTPGHRAYSAWSAGRAYGTWSSLSDDDRNRWENIAEAARS